jgi:fructose-1,6-bisphosphatase I
MPADVDLSQYCAAVAHKAPALGAAVQAVLSLAGAIRALSALTGDGALAGAHGAAVGTNADGDDQKVLDVAAHRIVAEAVRGAPVAYLLSEESEAIETIDAGAPLALAIDPLDGSSNIDTNGAIGTIFSILPADGTGGELGPFSGPGDRQIAAGFAIYGPQTLLVLTLGNGVDVFTFDRRANRFVLTRSQIEIAPGVPEYAINASNYRHWDPAVRTYIDDCIAGTEGPRGRDFNMRWNASLVAEVYRILIRGGIFLYPADARPGYREGRLRLLYEAHPIAFLVEQAGGKASNGHRRILELAAASAHQRTPLILGSRDKVSRVEELYRSPDMGRSHAPLFGRRGLFRT